MNNENNFNKINESPKSKKAGLIVIIGIVLVLLAVGGIFGGKYLFGKDDTSENPINNTSGNQKANNKEYNVGDIITFNNESWYVIKKSPKSDDHVTVIKGMVLNQPMAMVTKEYEVDYLVPQKYEDSELREYLESDYIKTLGEENLKSLNGYKIRLITVEELVTLINNPNENYDFSTHTQVIHLYDNENKYNAPEWVYSEDIVGTNQYWTMSKQYAGRIWFVNDSSKVLKRAQIGNAGSYYDEMGVRPVINLLKSSVK